MTMIFDIPPGRTPRDWLKIAVKGAKKQGLNISGEFPTGKISCLAQSGIYEIKEMKLYISLNNPDFELMAESCFRAALLNSDNG